MHAQNKNHLSGSGPHETNLVFICDAIGEQESTAGIPFMGKSKDLFERAIKANDLTRNDFFATSCLKCSISGQPKPQELWFEICAKHLFYQLELIKPLVICTMGPISTRTILKEYRYKEQIKSMIEIHGQPILIRPKGRDVHHKRIKVPSFKFYLVPTFNLAAVDNYTKEQTVIDDVGVVKALINFKSILN